MLEIVCRQTRQLEAFRADVLLGLSGGQKTLPCRWLYDDRGCDLFEEITRLEEYYPTRTETAILRDHAQEIADFCGEEAVLLEYGAGAGIKTEILIDALDRPRLYVPIDIAGDFLDLTVVRMRQRFPGAYLVGVLLPGPTLQPEPTIDTIRGADDSAASFVEAMQICRDWLEERTRT